MPEKLVKFKQDIQQVSEDIQKQAAGRFSIDMIDPEAGNGEIVGQIAEDYGFKPMVAGLFSNQQFYFLMRQYQFA